MSVDYRAERKLRWCVLALCVVALPSWATFQQSEQLVLDGNHHVAPFR